MVHCVQTEFEAGKKPISREGKTEEDFEIEESKQKNRLMGNIRFIGELFKKALLAEKIMHKCVTHLLGNVEKPQEEDLEAVCNLLTTIGATLDTPRAKKWVDIYFKRL